MAEKGERRRKRDRLFHRKKNSPVSIPHVNIHGYLEIEIREGRNLPNMDKGLKGLWDAKDVTDAYVAVKLDKTKIHETKVIDDDLNPEWQEKFSVDVCHFANHLIFNVKDKVIKTVKHINTNLIFM